MTDRPRFHCDLCAEWFEGENLLQMADDHMRVIHPAIYGNGPTRWPDGEIVVEDTTLDPEDFSTGDAP